MRETASRDRGDGGATGQPQGLGLGRFRTRGPPASGWAKRGGAGGRVVCGAKRIRSHHLPSLPGTPPGLCTPLRYKAGPHLTLSMPRLCAFAEQITLPRAIRSRLEAAPTAPLLTEPTRKDGQLRGRSRWFVHNAGCQAKSKSAPLFPLTQAHHQQYDETTSSHRIRLPIRIWTGCGQHG